MFEPTLEWRFVAAKWGEGRYLKVIVVTLRPLSEMMNNASPTKVASETVLYPPH